jgi:hypothetical protein
MRVTVTSPAGPHGGDEGLNMLLVPPNSVPEMPDALSAFEIFRLRLPTAARIVLRRSTAPVSPPEFDARGELYRRNGGMVHNLRTGVQFVPFKRWALRLFAASKCTMAGFASSQPLPCGGTRPIRPCRRLVVLRLRSCVRNASTLEVLPHRSACRRTKVVLSPCW